MRVSFDIDGVFADFVLGFTREADRLDRIGGRTIDVRIYQTDEQLEWKFPWPDWFYESVWDEIDATPNWWMTLDELVIEDDIEAVNKAIKAHDVYFITSRKRTRGLNVERQTEYWLDSIGVNASQATVIATQSSKKHKLCNAMDIDSHIDDRPDIIAAIANNSSSMSCKINRLYNANVRVGAGFDSVKEYCDWITSLSLR